MATGARKVVSLAHIKKADPPPDAPARIERPFLPTVSSGASKLRTNKDIALAKYLARKKSLGEMDALDGDIVRQAEQHVVERPEVLMSSGGGKSSISKEEALRRFQERKAAAVSSGQERPVKRRKGNGLDRDGGPPPRIAGFDTKAFVLAWVKTIGAGQDAVRSADVENAVAKYAGRSPTDTEITACDASLSAMVEAGLGPKGKIQSWTLLCHCSLAARRSGLKCVLSQI